MSTAKTSAAPWRLSEPSWRRIEPVLDALDPPRPFGRPRADRRLLLEGIVYHLKTGRPWRDEVGLFDRIWDLVRRDLPELQEVSWKWTPIGSASRSLRRAP